MGAAAANAYVIDFENVDTTNAPFAALIADGDYVTQGGFFVQGQDIHNDSDPYAPSGFLVGSLVNGADSGTCLDGVCPAGNATNYYATVNDSVVHFGLMSGGNSSLSSFDAAFLAPSGVTLASGTVAYLAIDAERSDGSYAVGIFPLGGLTADGSTAFTTLQASSAQIIEGTGTLSSGRVTDMFAYAYYCSDAGCSAFDSNKGQFALDNIAINVSAVPEPSQGLLLLSGLGAVGAIARRRRAR